MHLLKPNGLIRARAVAKSLPQRSERSFVKPLVMCEFIKRSPPLSVCLYKRHKDLHLSRAEMSNRRPAFYASRSPLVEFLIRPMTLWLMQSFAPHHIYTWQLHRLAILMFQFSRPILTRKILIVRTMQIAESYKFSHITCVSPARQGMRPSPGSARLRQLQTLVRPPHGLSA